MDKETHLILDVLAFVNDCYSEEFPDADERERVAKKVVEEYDPEIIFNYLDGLIQEEIPN